MNFAFLKDSLDQGSNKQTYRRETLQCFT